MTAKNPRRKIKYTKPQGSVALINKEICIFADNEDMDTYIDRLTRSRKPYEFIVLKRQNKSEESCQDSMDL